MLTAIREVQIPLLAAMLLGACAAKVWRALRAPSDTARTDPAGLFPAHLQRPIMILVFAAELGLGLGLIGTALKFGGTRPALLATIARPGLLCASAVATLGLPPLRMPSSSAEAELWLAVLAFELALLAFLSPELSEIMVGLGYSEPCELRRLPVGRTMTALHASSPWRKYAGQISAAAPSDVWREGCWRFVVYPGHARGRQVDIVFAVYLQSRRPAVRAAILDADTDEVLGPAGTRESAVI